MRPATVMSHGNTSASRLSNMTRTHGNEDAPRPITRPQSPQRQDAPSVGVPNSEMFDAPASDNGSDSDAPVIICAPRNTRTCREPTSSQLGFYKGHWCSILISAKALFRYHIHTDNPFPERNDENLKLAHECLLEAANNYLTDNEYADVDKGKLSIVCSILANNVVDLYMSEKDGMIALVSYDSTFVPVTRDLLTCL